MNKVNSKEAMIPNPGIIFKPSDEKILAYDSSSDGKVELHSNLCNLPPGIWFTDGVGMNELLFEPSKNHYLLADDWLGISIKEIAGEWGLNLTKEMHHYRLICWILKRILLLTCLILKTQSKRGETDTGWLGDNRLFLSSPSLYKAINRQSYRLEIQRPRTNGISPWELEGLTLFGSVGKKVLNPNGTNPPIFSAKYPRFPYLSKLAHLPVPRQGKWNKIKITEKNTELTPENEKRLGHFDEPVICFGKFNPRTNLTHPWVREWINGEGSFGRTAFTLKEIQILREYGTFLVENILVGSGWEKPTSSNSTLVRYLEYLVRICGGTGYAKSSWTAGIIAQSLFQGIAVYSSIQNQSNPHYYAWMAAEDRIRMLPIIKVLNNYNIRIVSACGGVVRFHAPMEDLVLEQLRKKFSTIGVALTCSQVPTFRKTELPDGESLRQFRGSKGSQRLQFLIHYGLGKWLWRYDSLIGLNSDAKEVQLVDLNSRIANRYA